MAHNSADSRVREVEGRLVQDVNELYMLPADATEHDRLELQSFAQYLALEGNYPPTARDAVRAALAPRPGRRAAVLDVGTGSAAWAVAMAREFPHADVLGVDLVPVVRTGDVPANCRFEIANINDGLAAYHGTFDVVHARSITPGLKSLAGYVAEAFALLRPGGVLLFADGDVRLYDGATPPAPLADDACAMQRLFAAAGRAMTARGSRLDGFHRLGEIVRADAGRWSGVGDEDVFIPVGNWKAGADPREAIMATVLGRDAVMAFGAMRPLLSQIVSSEETDALIRAAVEEGTTLGAHVNSVWRYLWAVRV